MSGGASNKKRVSGKTQGWEEAGGEFYSERYPTGDIELDVFQRDPSHIATLLPSKQSRFGKLFYLDSLLSLIEFINNN